MTAQQSLRGKNAIVTGGSRGIGKGIALELASRGANILLTYNSSRQQAEEVASQIRRVGVDAIAVEGKADDLSAPKNIVDAAAERWGCIDIVINNAGAREDYPVEAMTYEAFDRQIAVNLRFPVFLIKEATRHFGKTPRIVNLSRVYARDGQPGCLAYVASKGAMESLTRSLAKELGHKYSATINCVSPGPVNTELWASTLQSEEKEQWDQVIQSTPAAPRVAEVDDIAQIVAFLSEEGRSAVDHALKADGTTTFPNCTVALILAATWVSSPQGAIYPDELGNQPQAFELAVQLKDDGDDAGPLSNSKPLGERVPEGD
ncbi:unnamed protein product [Aspergillus oryzae var. brunneus]|uniref:Unnamed protein product n=1 Tax=Aspergillus oryzae var. brunneus TaxID=332754 RepID=A0ABQ6KSZ3_ASPOZ|nr:unnamed protein product [Aspergillus oryzae var. brunneus]